MTDEKGTRRVTETDGRAAMRARLIAAGLDPEEVAATLRGPRNLSIAETLPDALTALRRETRSYKTWGPYLQILAGGLPDDCPCPCPACSTGPCGCARGLGGHSASCQPPRDEPDLDCAARYAGVGQLDVTDLKADHVIDGAWWAERRGLKRTVRRNARRKQQHRVLLTADGRGAREQFIQACRWFGEWLLRREAIAANPAKRVKLPRRREAEARALDAAEFVEVYQVAVTTGRDPELDGLILRHLLIHAQRRGGLLHSVAGGIDLEAGSIRYWDQKRRQWRSRPSAPTHLTDLVAHVLGRGNRIAAPPDAPEGERRHGVPAIGEDDPLFYHPPIDTFDDDGYFVSREVRPVSRKRVESLFARVRRHLDWADRRGLRCHDVRHTSGRMVYKAADQQMARLHLAHDAASTTDHYLTEQMAELAKLKCLLFEPPPDLRTG